MLVFAAVIRSDLFMFIKRGFFFLVFVLAPSPTIQDKDAQYEPRSTMGPAVYVPTKVGI